MSSTTENTVDGSETNPEREPAADAWPGGVADDSGPAPGYPPAQSPWSAEAGA